MAYDIKKYPKQNYSEPTDVKLNCNNGRERDSIKRVLNKIEQMDDRKLELLFQLMPHEVSDVKDTLKRSVV